MNEKQATAVFVRQLKPAIKAMKREVSNRTKRRWREADAELTVKHGSVLIVWERFEHAKCLWSFVGKYAVSVPMPAHKAKVWQKIEARRGCISVLDTLNKLAGA